MHGLSGVVRERHCADWPTTSHSQSNKILLSFQNTENIAPDAVLDTGGHLTKSS